MGFINSPFFLTVVAGLLLTLLTTFINANINDAIEKRQLLQTKLNAKLMTMKQFGDGIAQYLQCSYEMRRRAIWIRANYKNTDKTPLRYHDNHTFQETCDLWEKQREKYNTISHADSLCAYARAVFSDAPELLIEKIEALDRILDTYMITFDEKELGDSYSRANDAYQEIIGLMGQHIEVIQGGI